MSDLGIVVIGRNEGDRLVRSLDSVRNAGCPVIYVDSNSSDESVATAGQRDIPVHVLDATRPMNAARARNEGFAWLLKCNPGLRFVQFVDGDTELASNWLVEARGALAMDARLGVVAGHLGERQVSKSVYHLLAALEWRKAPGAADATGGIFMARTAAFAAAGGFDGNVPAGEEADLCMRVRARGFTVAQIDAYMGTHDMGDIGLRTWWLRNLRTGHGYAQGTGAGRYQREARSALAWGIALPVLALACAWPSHGWSMLLLLAFPMQMVRVYLAARGRRWTRWESSCYGFFTVLAKAPEALGVVR
jgi:glycosyltransferase involved in cell wall biosynthesis